MGGYPPLLLRCTAVLIPPPPNLHKHQESQESDGQTGSWCLDKAVLAHNARYQKNTCPKNRPIPHPKHNSHKRALEHNVQANFSKFWRSSLPIRGIRSCGIEALSDLAPHLEQWHMLALWGRLWGRLGSRLWNRFLFWKITPKQRAVRCTTKQNVVMSRRTHHKHDTAPLSLYNRHTITLCLVSDHKNCGQKIW